MSDVFDPFKMFGRLCVATFQIASYTAVFAIQVCGYIRYRRQDKIVDAFGYYGRGVTDAVARVFHH